MKTDELLKQGLTQEQVDFVMAENGKDLKKLQKENETLTADRDNWKTKAETAEETLKGFDGKDFDTITRERDEWKRKAEDAEKDYSAKLAEREKEDLLKEAFSDIKFSSEAAKKSIMQQISDSINVKNGKLIGFNDLLDDFKKNDASAFVDEQEVQLKNNMARFTAPRKPDIPGKPMTKEEINAIKDATQRQAAIAQNLSLYGK